MADNFENIPVDITAEELVERVKKPIDNKPKSGSENFITSGGVYNATADKVSIFSATIRSYADFDALFQNENIDTSKAIFEILVSSLGEVASVLGGGASLWGIISNNTLLLLNKENGEKWLYINGSSLLEKYLVKKGGIEADSITPWELDRVYVEYDGKWTISTFAELNDILPENYSSVLQAFSFPKNSELYNAVNGTDFIALHEVFINTNNGKVWKYSNGSFTTKSLISKSRIVSKVDDLNELFDEDVDVLNLFTVLGYSTLPNSQYYATKVIYSAGLNGYLMTDVVNGKTYFYNRKSGEFKNFSTETSAGLSSTHIAGYNEAEADEIAKTTLSGDGIIFVDGGGQTNYIIIQQTDSSGWIKQTKLIFGKYNDTRSSGIYWRQYGSGNWTDWVGFVDAELNEESENPVMNKVVAQALKNVGSGGTGKDGGYYTPSVDAEGNLSWTPSKKNMPEVENSNIKGEKGETGAQGPQGETGATGPAGKDGVDGYTPVKGVDYYTEEDKAEFEEYIASELAKRGQLKPEFANNISECTDTTMLYVLPDGLIYAYMLTEVSKEPTNLLPLATDTDRKTVYNGKGFKENTRISGSSGSTSDATGIFATGFIPATAGDVLYFKNIAWTGLTQKCYIIAFDSSNAITGKLEILGSTASPAPTSPVTLDSATFGSGFNAIRISASDISTDTVITINESIEGGTTTEYGWASTGHAFVPADYEDRIIHLENEVESLKVSGDNSVIPLVKFDYDHNLTDVSSMVSNFQVSSHDLRKQKTVPTVYSLFDELVSAYPDYVSKEDAANLVGLTYPEYANGITTAGTYAVTPAYKTYMYKLSYGNAYSGNEGRHKHKKMLLIGGLDGSEYVPPYNLYILAKRLCEDFLIDSNLFKLRNAFDIYIVPCLNGYGLYHGTKYNANGVAITRNMPTKAWVEADKDDPNYYTGSVAGSEFETQLVMKLTEHISPDVAIDHHSYGYLPTQFYSELPKEDFAKLAYQSLVDCSLTFSKNLPEYFGTKFKLFQDREGATSAPAQVANVRGTQTWWDENGVPFGGLIEVSVSINYLNGQLAGEGQDLYGNDTFSVAEYTLRNQLLRYCEFVLNS